MEEQTKKISKRLQIWAGFFIIVGFVTVIFLPLEKAQTLFDFFKEIIINLIIVG